MPNDKQRSLHQRFLRVRWLRYSLRSFFVVITLLALWLGHSIQQARNQAAAIDLIQSFGGAIHYEYELSDKNLNRSIAGLDPERPHPEWLTRVFGDDFFYRVSKVAFVGIDDSQMKRLAPHLQALPRLSFFVLHSCDVTDEGLQYVRELTGLERLSFSELPITDDGLKHFEDLTRLKMLLLQDCNVTGSGLVHVKGATNLERLSLRGTKLNDKGLMNLAFTTQLWDVNLERTDITDAGLVALRDNLNLKELYLGRTNVTGSGFVHFRNMSRLEQLRLNYSHTTDMGLRHLAGLTNLKALNVRGTQVTDEGISELQRIIKNCEISH